MFSQQQTELSNRLNEVSSKISFPAKLLENLTKSGLKNISNQMSYYNKNICQAKKLYTELSTMTKWGFFMNSYKSWKFSTDKIILYDNHYKEQILELSIYDNSGGIRAMLKNQMLKQSNVNSTCLNKFMHTYKEQNNSYWIELFDVNKGEIVKSQISHNDILAFLPVCFIMERGKTIFDCANPIKSLDEFDIIVELSEIK